MIGQAEVHTPTRGVYADLNRDLSIADLKANAAAITGAVKPIQEPNGSDSSSRPPIPRTQTVLLLYQPRTAYALTPKHPVPRLHYADELLLKVHAIGLNPIDWKAPDYGFGIPHLPYIAGRDYIGTIALSPPGAEAEAGAAREQHHYLAISTNYRDPRTSAFQTYAIAPAHTICRVPSPPTPYAGCGVAFVAAALSLGLCLGLDFSGVRGGPDYRSLLHGVRVPADVAEEAGGRGGRRLRRGDAVVVWGGGTATAGFVGRLAGLAGCRVVGVVDGVKHGKRLAGVRQEGVVWVDSHDAGRAVEAIRGITGGVRYGVDTVGRESAGRVVEAFGSEGEAHLVGLAAAPKEVRKGVVVHAVPIKLFHEVPAVGAATMKWLERLLAEGVVAPPEVVVEKGGLAGVNGALDRMRRGEISGKRLVVEMDD